MEGRNLRVVVVKVNCYTLVPVLGWVEQIPQVLFVQKVQKALKKQMPGVEVELNDIQANWLDKEQKVHLHLELDPDLTKAQLIDILIKFVSPKMF